MRIIPLALLIALITLAPTAAQQPAPPPATPTLHVDTSLTLVEVVAEYKPNGLRRRALIADLKKDDFLVSDDGVPRPILSFDVGSQHTTRPITLWLIVQCDEGLPLSDASMFWRGKVNLLLPALRHLAPGDTLGVAHWCDNGIAEIDLQDSKDPAAAVDATEHVLDQKQLKTIDSRKGELAMQRLIDQIVAATSASTPKRLPVLLFLYGDQSATYYGEAVAVLKSILETSGMVFGINDGTVPYYPGAFTPHSHQLEFLAHFYSTETGGQYYSTPDPQLFSNALDYVLSQVHLRYTIGFKPEIRDGKLHKIKVQLTDQAKATYGDVELRYRTEYIPTISRDDPVNHP